MTCRSDRVSMTLKQAEKMMADIRTMQKLARNEGASNRLQNTLDRCAVQIKKSIGKAKAMERTLF